MQILIYLLHQAAANEFNTTAFATHRTVPVHCTGRITSNPKQLQCAAGVLIIITFIKAGLIAGLLYDHNKLATALH